MNVELRGPSRDIPNGAMRRGSITRIVGNSVGVRIEFRFSTHDTGRKDATRVIDEAMSIELSPYDARTLAASLSALWVKT